MVVWTDAHPPRAGRKLRSGDDDLPPYWRERRLPDTFSGQLPTFSRGFIRRTRHVPAGCGFVLMTKRFGGFGLTGMRLAAAACVLTAAVAVAPGIALAAPDSAIVVDIKSGKVLYSQSPDAQRYPASLTKMMTLYLLFDALEAHKTSLNARITVSAHAAAQAPSKLGLKPGQTISVRDAILALVTKSANDVATAIAEHVAGSESAFARRMTSKARQLGMSRTTFRNANGLPDPGQVTTARDMATLGRALQEHHPEYFSYFATPSFVWKGRRIGNHDRLLGRVAGVNGIKTGYTRASGFNLVTSVSRNNRKLVGVVLGGETSRWRDKRMAELVETYLPKASTRLTVAALPGATKTVAAIDPKDLPIPSPRPSLDQTETASVPPPAVAAPKEEPGQPVSVASLVGANSIFALDAGDQGDAAVEEDASDAATPGAVITGWKIQLAATPTQSSAEDVLDRALSGGASVLGKASPYTEPVVRGETTLYRARFAGFAGKNEARAACAYLAKRDFDCLAISD